jgi:hypothetical protein
MERPPKEKESGVSRIVGTSEENERLLLRRFKALFEHAPLSFERQKTADECQIIHGILQLLPSFLKRYGVDALKVHPDQLHFVDVASLTSDDKRLLRSSEDRGYYFPRTQTILIFPEGNKLRDAEAIVHELLHVHSFTSYTATGDKLQERRVGLEMISSSEEGPRYFRSLNEAVTEELTMRFDQRYYSRIPVLRRELQDRKRVRRMGGKNAGEVVSVATRKLEGGDWHTTIDHYAFPQQRQLLAQMVDDIYEAHSPQFRSTEDVFKMFARAMFNGRILRLARMIEETYGRGSFPQLAAETKEIA